MRSVLLAVLATTLIVATADAQRFALGVKGGFSRATVNFEDPGSLDVSWRSGFHGGVFARLSEGAVALELGGLYSRKGYSAQAPGIDADAKAGYAMVPLTARIGITSARTGKVMPYLFAGPAVGFELSCDVSGSAPAGTLNQSCDDFGLERKKVDVTAVFGAGIDIDLGGRQLFVEAAYDYGLRNVNDDPLDTDTVRTRTLNFSAGISFPLGG